MVHDLPVYLMGPQPKGENDFEVMRFLPLQLTTPDDMSRVVTEVKVVLPAVAPNRQYAVVLMFGGPTPLHEVEKAIQIAEWNLLDVHQRLKMMYATNN